MEVLVPYHVEGFISGTRVYWGFFYCKNDGTFDANITVLSEKYAVGNFQSLQEAAKAVTEKIESLSNSVDRLSEWRNPEYALYVADDGGKWTAVAANSKKNRLEPTGIYFNSEDDARKAIKCIS